MRQFKIFSWQSYSLAIQETYKSTENIRELLIGWMGVYVYVNYPMHTNFKTNITVVTAIIIIYLDITT